MDSFHLIQDFILPSLEEEIFGDLLQWKDRKNGVFQVLWNHKSGRKWKRDDFLVFITWDERKGRTEENSPAFYTNSKGRFRSALTRLKSQVKFLRRFGAYRVYQLKHFSQDFAATVKNDTNENGMHEMNPIDTPVSVESNCSADSGIASEIEFPDEIFSLGNSDNYQPTITIEPQNNSIPIQYSNYENCDVSRVIVGNNEESSIPNDTCENILNLEVLPLLTENLYNEDLLTDFLDLDTPDATMDICGKNKPNFT